MLTHLTIKNYALIEHLELKPSSHLNVITGETGAGKSIMLGAIGLLLGNRADTKVLWDENEKCVAEAIFDVSELNLNKLLEEEDLDVASEVVLRREINSSGKSRAFINDTPVTLDVMRKIGSRLMDVHSQHETLDLGNKTFQLNTVDTFASNVKLRTLYEEAWREFTDARMSFNNLETEASRLQQEADFVKFQLDELVKADIQEGQQETWESELKIREHAEDIKMKFNQIVDKLSSSEFSVQSTLNEIRSQLSQLAGYSDRYSILAERIESAFIELRDIGDEIEREEAAIDVDPEKTEEIKEKLSSLYQLMQKHHAKSVTELLKIQSQLQAQSDKTENLDAELAAARTRFENAQNVLKSAAAKLSESRKKAFPTFCRQMIELLKQLGIPEARISVDHQIVSPTSAGADAIEFQFSANKGIAERPLAQVASGGEFSRLMFCLKYLLAEKAALPTLVLDEIDTGVSGEIAIQLGVMMKNMSGRHQLIAITHLPQIAAKAERHFFAYKETHGKKTVSQIKSLDENERIEEIAKMIGGAKPSKLAMENARELIGI